MRCLMRTPKYTDCVLRAKSRLGGIVAMAFDCVLKRKYYSQTDNMVSKFLSSSILTMCILEEEKKTNFAATFYSTLVYLEWRFNEPFFRTGLIQHILSLSQKNKSNY